MTLREKIAPDIPMIDEYLHVYGSPSAMAAATYLKSWEEAKGEFLEGIFGDDLILRKPVVYEKSVEILNDELIEARGHNHEVWDHLMSELRDLMTFVLTKQSQGYYHAFGYGNPNSDEWHERHEVDRKFILYVTDELFHFYSTDLAANAVSMNFSLVPDGETYLKKKFQVQKGEKPFRLIRRILTTFQPIAEEHDPLYSKVWLSEVLNSYEICRCKVSEVLTDKLIKGVLTLSIHPMDFLTMSDNNYDWDSCMTWTRSDCPGEYHAGTLEMMNSPHVIVAYIEGEKEYYPLNNYRWSNKKWRELFIVDRNFVAGICGYPFHLEAAEVDVLNWLADRAESAGYPAYSREVVSRFDSKFEICGVEGWFTTNVMYNDTDYHGTRMLKSTDPAKEKLCESYFYGGTAYCLVCGEAMTDYDQAEHVICGHCRGDVRCESCGDYISRDNDSYSTDDDGHYFCYDCSEMCSTCGDLYPPDTLLAVGLVFDTPTHRSPVSCESACLCDWCRAPLRKHLFRGNINKLLGPEMYWGGEYDDVEIVDGDSAQPSDTEFLFDSNAISWRFKNVRLLTKAEILQQATA